jgi:pimeloyl-ACP methyl ester carboxylesterase
MSALLGGCRFVQDSLLYYPARLAGMPAAPPPEWTSEPVALDRPDGVVLRGWLVKPPGAPAPLVVYFGGNAEEVSWQIASAHRYGRRALALVNYRGYGESTGAPREAALEDDAAALFDALAQRADVEGARVAAVGRSLGTGLAVHLAAHRPVERVVLISPFDSMAAVGAHHFPAALVRAVLSDRYDAAALAPRIRAPLLAIAAQRDDIIPVARSQALFAAWGGPKTWLALPRGGHNDLQAQAEFWPAIEAFLAR